MVVSLCPDLSRGLVPSRKFLSSACDPRVSDFNCPTDDCDLRCSGHKGCPETGLAQRTCSTWRPSIRRINSLAQAFNEISQCIAIHKRVQAHVTRVSLGPTSTGDTRFWRYFLFPPYCFPRFLPPLGISGKTNYRDSTPLSPTVFVPESKRVTSEDQNRRQMTSGLIDCNRPISVLEFTFSRLVRE